MSKFLKILTQALIILFMGISIDTNTSKSELLRNDIVSIEEAPEEKDNWDLFIEAVIWKESRGDEKAIGDNGRAVGVLQLHPIMVDEANRILGLNGDDIRYTYDDRFNREKSIEMFNVVQDYKNKDRDFIVALNIWNIGHPDSYREDILNKYEEFVSNS